MDYKDLDRVRRSTTPLQLDVVESFARGRLSRREFIKRGTVVGLSLASISAVIAACDRPATGSTAPSGAAGSPGASASGVAEGTPGPAGGSIKVAVQRPAATLDPIAMQDLSAYGLLAQSFEFLAALDPTSGDIGPGLATEWTPNEDNSKWTFKLRAAKWQKGGDFTSADVVATMDRLAEAGNAGLKGVIEKGSTKAVDPTTVEFTLVGPNGNFPYLVSVFNAQSLITPVAYATGTTLDGLPDGTGPWKLDSYDHATGAKYSRSDTWWGGATPLDSVEFIFFDEPGPMVTAYQGGQIDAINQFDVNSGAGLFDDPNFNALSAKTTNHRQIWMRCDTGQFADVRVRQALALSLDRDAMVQQLFKGKGEVANDHVIFSLYPYFDASVPQKTRDVEKAKSLLAEAGKTGLKATLHAATLQEIPDLAVLIQSNAKDAGIELTPAVESLDTFYGAQWCPADPADPPCSGAAELGIVDYGHRASPDVFLNSAFKTNGAWNSSQYSSPEFDKAFTDFQRAVGVDAQKAAAKTIETIMSTDTPAAIPYTYDFLSGFSKKFTGVYSSALGQMFFEAAKQA